MTCGRPDCPNCWFVWATERSFVLRSTDDLIRFANAPFVHPCLKENVAHRVFLVYAYLHLLAEPFPPFDGRPGYEVSLVVAPPERQNRATVAFRLILAIPVLIVMHVLTYLMGVLALVSWVVSVVLGRLPHGLRSLGLWCLRFQQQTAAYTHLLTQRYPSFDMDGGEPAPATELSPAA